MGLAINRNAKGVVNLKYTGENDYNLSNLTNVKIIESSLSLEGAREPIIIILYTGGSETIIVSQLDTINGVAKPGTVKGIKDLLAADVFINGGGSGEGGQVAWGDITDKPTIIAAGASAAVAVDAIGAVDKTRAQTIAGIKTFSSIPVLPSALPTTNNQAASKLYVDGKMVQLTQAQYDALPTKVAGTLYLIPVV